MKVEFDRTQQTSPGFRYSYRPHNVPTGVLFILDCLFGVNLGKLKYSTCKSVKWQLKVSKVIEVKILYPLLLVKDGHSFFYLIGLIDFIINKNNEKYAFEIKTNTNSCVKSILPGGKKYHSYQAVWFKWLVLTCKSSFHEKYN